jgi:hypothetical protein
MTQMAAQTGIPMSILREAVKSGCTFMRHGRCDLFEFLQWFFARPESEAENANWDKRDKRAKALMREDDLAERRKQLIEFDIVGRFLDYLTSGVFFAQLQKLREEFPVTLKGKTELEIHHECERQFGSVQKSIDASLKTWLAKEGKPE